MNLLWTDNLTNLSTNYLISPGRYAAFLIRYAGTAQSAQTVTSTDCGNVILNALGADKINVDVDFLSQADNLYYGAVEASSAAGGAFAFSIYIPAGLWFDPVNTFVLSQQMQSYFKLDFPLMTSSIVASGTVQICGLLQNGNQSYWHNIYSFNVVAQGSGNITNTIAKPNISTLYLKNPTALIGQTQISKDSVSYANNAIANELAYSNLIHQVETASTLYACEFCPGKIVNQAQSTNLTYQYSFSGAGTLAQYYSQVQYM